MKTKTQYVCQNCGMTTTKWVGRCDGCGSWNTLEEEIGSRAGGASTKGIQALSFTSLSTEIEEEPRVLTGMPELDRVLGGGIVPGSVILIGGDPGIGKSTLLLQMSSALCRSGISCAYISGEESVRQVQLRAKRLGLEDSPVALSASGDVRAISQALSAPNGPKVAIIDSIQTMSVPELDSAPGTVSQIRASANELIRVAKERDVAIFLVGHVTKEGNLSGPKVLEHAVDCSMFFEGSRDHQYRILRATKNRFGATDEIGVFEMGDTGLTDVINPSQMFLSDRLGDTAGSVVFPGIEGSRPILVEIQALVSESSLGSPRRAVVGWDSGRLAMVLAVLEARGGISLGSQDIYLNVVGGFRISEPAADLAVATAILSSITKAPVPSDMVVFGEIGLGGEIRPVGQSEHRLKEAAKLGFNSAYLPKATRKAGSVSSPIKGTISMTRITDLIQHFSAPTT